MKTIKNSLIANSKRIVLALLLITAFSANANAQRFVYVDMDYILENLPEYSKAQEKLDAVSESWRAEIATKMEDVETSYKRFQSEQVLMNDKMKSEKIYLLVLKFPMLLKTLMQHWAKTIRNYILCQVRGLSLYVWERMREKIN